MNMINEIYDLIIIGSGPAGLTAGLYATRYKLKTLVIGKMNGGLMTESHKICNFPTEKDISGLNLTQKIIENATSQGVNIINDELVDIQKENENFNIKLLSGKNFSSKTIILALGTTHRHLGIEKEKEFLGRGVSYCATCDGMFFKNKTVGVVGGSDSALTSALYLADIAEKVYLIYRGQKLRGEPIWVEKISQQSNIEVLLETNITKLVGKERLTEIELDKSHNNNNQLNLDGLFIEIGHTPDLGDYVEKLKIELDEQGHIKVGPDQKTTHQGIWAAGDITTNSNGFRQIITACAEGAIAADNIFHYIQSL